MPLISMLRRCGDLSLRASVGASDPRQLDPKRCVRLSLPNGHEVELTPNETRTLGHMLLRLMEVPLEHIELAAQAMPETEPR